jgi:hypothetical protein
LSFILFASNPVRKQRCLLGKSRNYPFLCARKSKKRKNMQYMVLREYEAPQVEIIEVEVEKGFAGSGNEDGNGGGMTLPGWEII